MASQHYSYAGIHADGWEMRYGKTPALIKLSPVLIWEFVTKRSRMVPCLRARSPATLYHVEQSYSCVSSHQQVSGFGQPRQWADCTRSGDFIHDLLLCSQICDASGGVALKFKIWRQHQSDQRIKATALDNEEFVTDCAVQISQGAGDIE